MRSSFAQIPASLYAPLLCGSLLISGCASLPPPTAELDAARLTAQNNGKPLLLDWYADWCISCKVIEREVLNAPEVGRQLGDYQLVRFDITESNPAQRALLDRYQLFGPPAILLFDAKGDEWLDLRVVGEVDAATFAARLSTARERF